MMTLMETNSARLYASGLGDSESSLIRRIETMKARKDCKRASKWTVLGICLLFSLVSVLPAYAMTDQVAKAEEKWMAEIELKQYDDTYAVSEDAAVELTMVEDTVENPQVDMSNDISMYSPLIVVDISAKANTRYNFKRQSMQVGDQVGFTIQCSDPNVTYWIGIKNMNTNVVRYTSGTGTVSHTFTINEAGPYITFVENRSNTEADFLGSIIYPY